MDLFLFSAYVLILAAQIVLLIFAIRKPDKKLWRPLFGFELFSLLASVGLMFLFDSLPGNGFMPGLTWFAEWFYSLLAAGAYGIMLLLTAILCAIKKN